MNTVGPQITLYLQFNVLLSHWWKKLIPNVEFTSSPYICMGFPQEFRFPSTSKDVHVKWTRVSKWSGSEWVWVWIWVCVAMEGCPIEGGLPTLHPELLWKAWSPATLNWNKQVGKELSHLFLLIFLKCMCSLHLFQCLVLEEFGVFI